MTNGLDDVMSAHFCTRCGWIGEGADGCGTHGCVWPPVATPRGLAVEREALLADLRRAAQADQLERVRLALRLRNAVADSGILSRAFGGGVILVRQVSA